MDPPRRLVFTWVWGGDNPDGETLVTIELDDRGGKTELTLTHEGFATGGRREQRRAGWSSSLDCLENALPEEESPASGPGVRGARAGTRLPSARVTPARRAGAPAEDPR